jgi:hypothetical protein
MSILFYFMGLLILGFIYGSIYGAFIWILPDQCQNCNEEDKIEGCIKQFRHWGMGIGILITVFLIYIIVGFIYKSYEKTKSGINSGYENAKSRIKSSYQKASSAATRLGSQLDQSP